MTAPPHAPPGDDAHSADAGDERLVELRRDIDGIDEQLLTLLNRRAACSKEVGRIKRDSQDLIFKPFREKEVLARLAHANAEHGGVLPEAHLRAIYREILSSSRALQRPQRVAYLGPEGTFSHFAGVQFLGHSVDYTPEPSIPHVFEAVSSGRAELGIVPLENSLEGTVGQSLDHFLERSVYIQSELFCRIRHSLLRKAESLGAVRTVYSHAQPLAQCAGWLRSMLPHAATAPVESTAAAARRAAESEGDDDAAIGHVTLAARHGLNVLASGVEDRTDNWTRFVLIAGAPSDASLAAAARDKTSMLFTVPDKPGSLVNVLTALAGKGINMKKLESRPMQGETWKYVFFVDVECDLEQEDYASTLEELRHACHSLRILGSYPSGPYLDVSDLAPEPTVPTASDPTQPRHRTATS